MDCTGIKDLLSEYVDGALDPETRDLVDQHLLACANCRQELDSIRSLTETLRSLEPVQPPEEFLDQLHERMAPRFSLRRVMRALFLPARIKIPLELATALTAAIIIFSALSIQYPRTHIAGLRDSADVETAKKQRSIAEGPIEFVLVLEAAAVADDLGVVGGRSSPQAGAEGKGRMSPDAPMAEKETYAARQAAPSTTAGETEESDRIVSRVRSLIALAEGRMLPGKQDAGNHPRTVTAEIPSRNYNMFVNALASMGRLVPPPPTLPRNEEGILSIRIRIVPPENQG